VGDPTRDRLLDLLLVGGPGAATSLSEQLPVSRQAIVVIRLSTKTTLERRIAV
jgi:hypothetical protein